MKVENYKNNILKFKLSDYFVYFITTVYILILFYVIMGNK